MPKAKNTEERREKSIERFALNSIRFELVTSLSHAHH